MALNLAQRRQVLSPTGPLKLTGVNASSAEYAFSTFPSEANWRYIWQRGFRFARLQIAWERIQPTLSAALDATYLAQLHATLSIARRYGIRVLVDLHNYGRYDSGYTNSAGHDNPGGNASSFVLGSSSLTQAHFTDLWTRLATALSVYDHVSYGLMNEPHDLVGLNLLQSSNHFLNDQGTQAWFKNQGGEVITPRVTTSLSGFTDAFTITDGSAFGGVSQNVTMTAVSQTLSWEAFSASGTVSCNLSVDNGGFVGISVTTTKQRFSKTFTPTAGSHSVNFSFNTNNGSAVRIANACLQLGAGTTYIPDVWPTMAQAAITAIRAVDTSAYIYVMGDQFGPTLHWAKQNTNLIDLTDSANKLVFEAHDYWDLGSGLYPSSYATYAADGNGAGFARGQNLVDPFVTWAETYGADYFVGEFGWPNTDAQWSLVHNGFNQRVKIGTGTPQKPRACWWVYVTHKDGDPASFQDTGIGNIGRNNFSNAMQLPYFA